MVEQSFTDYFDKNCEDLKTKKIFLFDMDGTIYNEDKLFSGSIELFNEIEKRAGKYVFITNNSSKSVNEYVQKVNRLGIKAGIDNFFTSTQATILYLKKHFKNRKVYCQGTRSFIRELIDGGIDVTEEVSEGAEAVLIGFDTELTSQKLRNTCEMLTKDVAYIATNPDLACPVDFGFIPDCGSICQMLKNATGREPIFIGKPQSLIIDSVLNKFNYCKKDAVIIGDRLYTDIATGVKAGITSICVLTGEATVEDIKKSKINPTYTFHSVYEIYNCLKNPYNL